MIDNKNKQEVECQKIVHYLSDIEAAGHVFGIISEKILPNAIGCIGCIGYLALFSVVSNMLLTFG
jgi:hypothetical protein